MELTEGISLNDTIEYAPVYNIGARTENGINIPTGEMDSIVDTSKDGIYFSSTDQARAINGTSSQPATTNNSRPSKKSAVELFDENMYSLPSNPLPESSSPVSSSPSLKRKSKYANGWNCSTGSLIALILSIVLLVAGIFVAIYFPFTAKDEKGLVSFFFFKNFDPI